MLASAQYPGVLISFPNFTEPTCTYSIRGQFEAVDTRLRGFIVRAMLAQVSFEEGSIDRP
jgi:hypothetical protein